MKPLQIKEVPTYSTKQCVAVDKLTMKIIKEYNNKK